jgi:hypothetical protein
VIALTLNQGRITAIDIIRNPGKLNTLPGARPSKGQPPRASDSPGAGQR